MQSSSRKLSMVVEYDGTRYHGFQIQNGVPTIQGEIEQALMKATVSETHIVGAGRTDAGAHAKGQVISFETSSTLSAQTLVRAVNAHLPRDISIKSGTIVDSNFNARRDAVGREYRYTILNSPTPSPLYRKYSYFNPMPLDITAMNKACRFLTGKHDFASFTIPLKKSTVRIISRAEVSRKGELVRFDIAAGSFLPHQVRRTIGLLLKTGLGKLEPEAFGEIMEAKKPGLAAFAAPARGLCLMRVNYPEQKLSKGQTNENL
ncbi:tRNA pseudouridine(38-40) synthase TruA [Chloroflexota bacterium]